MISATLEAQKLIYEKFSTVDVAVLVYAMQIHL